MSKTALLVMGDSDRDLSDLITRTLEADEVAVIPQKNEKGALKILHDAPIDFIAVALALAPDSASPARADGGIAFCEAARAISPAPMALIVPAVTNALQQRLSRIASPPVCFLVDSELPSMLLQQVLATAPPARRLDVVIRADPTGWTYELRGTGFVFDRRGRLNVMQANLGLLKTVAQALREERTDWADIFRGLGRGIVDCFLEQNDVFRQQLCAGIETAEGIANTRVSFAVADVYYEIALEAILTPLEELPEPWMIHAPLVRNIASAVAANGQLFEGPPRPLRCLILCADASGMVEFGQGVAPIVVPRLPHLRKECEEVRRLFSRVARQLGFDEPRVVGADDAAPLTKERLLDVLRESEPWDVVHYAGHSYHAHEHPALASLIVSGGTEPVAVRINELAPYLRRSKLVYLSSCNSANAGFAFEAVQQGIPAVVGFRWGVRDDFADIHARLFYRKLFKERAIDTALWKTRRAMHRMQRGDRTWASSMLVMQAR
jgi:CHAT domain